MVAFAFVALLIGLTTPVAMRFYDTMQYRSAVRDLVTAASSARYQAVVNGVRTDLVLDTRDNRFQIIEADDEIDGDLARAIAGDLAMKVIAARELRRGDKSVIRFYPGGGSSGGSISVQRDSGAGVRLRVDWLLGNVSQEPL